MKEYNKLVRDKIPEVIKATGKECEFEIAPKEERYKLLEAKLNEEVRHNQKITSPSASLFSIILRQQNAIIGPL